ncbi:Ig-like domain-containing protein [Pontibacter chinhatensis]|uniref:Por secretion system C-terminal sorting domain-containing protein n=1 Tax=Pontibacter chinhatensis TaxID=1436961 RepID=A0A1I2YF25_9BACT|nr:T9SS type A sorting domain-containing protein [Pontibacter chinhatensis]SFH24250.1 Por secretion system C-terminal sorting domain-containing protein [Pontibacter chinhatensis]
MKQRFTQLIAKAISARLGKVYLTSWLLLLFLMMGNVALGQPTTIYNNGFTSAAGLSFEFTYVGTGGPVISNNELLVPGTNGNPRGYQGYVVVNTGLTIYPDVSYRVSVRARENAGDGKLEILSGSSITAAKNPANRILTSTGNNVTSTTYRTLNSNSFTVNAQQTLYIGLYVETAINNASMFIDDLIITQTCVNLPAAPNTTPNSRCGNGAVTLSASGAPNGGSYRWYSTVTGGTALTNSAGATVTGPSFTTPSLTTTTTYYVSTVSPAGCESATRTAVTATINDIPNAPTAAEQVRCGPGTVTLTASGAPASGSYRWYISNTATTPIDGATSADFTTPALAAGESRTYFVTSVSAAGCESATRTAVVARAIQTPTATVTPASPPAVCQGQTVLLTAQASPAAPSGVTYNYRWYNGDTAIPGATSATYSAATSGSYSVEISTSIGACTSARSNAVAVTVTPQPTVTVTADPAAICAGGSTTLTASGADSYTWSPAAGLSATSGATVTASPATTTTYTVTAVSGGCTVTSQVTVTVNPNPVAVITQGPNAVVCEGENVTLTAQTGTGYSYQWYLDGVIITGGTESSISTDASGSYTVEVTLGECTVMSAATIVTEQALPTIGITEGSELEFCAGGSVVLTAVADPETPEVGTYTYRWFEESSPETTLGTAQTYEVFASGTYNVEVTVNTCSVVAVEPITVTVHQLPPTTITPTGPTDFCTGGSVVLNAPVPTTGEYTYQWLLDGEEIIGETSSSLTVRDSGSYSVIVTSEEGCPNTSAATVVRVSNVEEAAITFTPPTEFCEGGSVLLEATQAPVGQTYTYQWLVNGEEIDGATGRTYLATATGDYSVRVSNGICTKTSTEVTVTVSPQPAASITSGGAAVCFVPGNTASFEVTATFTGETAEWSSDNGSFVISNQVINPETGVATATVTATGTGSATITLTASNSAAGCADASSAVVLQVKPLPTATITTSTPTTFCQGGNVVLSAPEATGNTYQWFLNGASIPGAISSSYTASAAGDYTVVVTNNECSVESAATTVTVNPAPTATISASGPTVFCSGGSITLTANTDIGTDFTWFRNGTEQVGTGPTLVVSESGSYTVSVSVSGTDCNTTSAATVVTVNPTPTATIQTSGPVTFCQGGTVTLTAPPAPAGATYAYQWFRGTTPVGTTRQITADISGDYTVRVTQGSCNATSAATTVTVNPTPTLVINNPAAVCSPTTVDLTAAAITSGSTPGLTFTYWTNEAATAPLSNPSAVAASGTYYIRGTSGAGCSVVRPVQVIINTTPATPTITNLTAGRTYFTGERFAGNYFFTLTGSPPPAGGTAVFSGPGVSLVNGTYRFTPCDALTGGQSERTFDITYTVSNANSNGSCSNSTSVTITVRRSTYTVVLQTVPFPVCKSVNTQYTARVLRDAVVTYPNPADIRTVPINVVDEGEDVSELFTIQSGIGQGNNLPSNFNNGASFSNSSLSSEEFYISRAIPRNNALPSCASTATIFSNRIYLGTPNVSINMSNPGSICPGTDVTFTATPDAVPGTLSYQWTINDNPVPGATGPTFTTSTLQNGDRVAVRFTAAGSPCGTATSNNSITMVVVVPQTVTAGNYCAGTTGASVTIGSSQTGVSYQLVQIAANGTTTNIGNPVAGTGRSISFTNQTAGTYSVIPIAARPGACGMFNQVTINETPLPTAFNVTGGGRFCTNGSGVPIGLSGSQVGVNYQLRRSVNGGAATNVGIPVAGTGAAISFGNQTVAGTYTVEATSVVDESTAACSQGMTGSATVIVDPLPTVTVNSPTTCENAPVTVNAVPSGGTGPYTYTWTVPAGWSGPVPTTASFQTAVAGIYTVRVTDSRDCASSAAATSTVTVNPRPTVSVNSPTVCAGETATVIASATGGLGPYTYTWTVPSGFDNPGNVASFPTTVAGTYSVIVTDSRSCSSSEAATSTVTVNPIRTSRASLYIENEQGEITAANPILPGEWLKITALSDIEDEGAALSYEWSIGNDVGNEWNIIKTNREDFLIIDPVEPGEFNVRVRITPNNNGVICFDPVLLITTEPLVPLPVEIIYFTAAKQGNNVLLEWATASEENNTGFEVQVSQDGFNFRKLDFVPTKNGNTVIKQVYQYTDKENGKRGTRYYRLKQIDEDGRFEYFTTKAVTFSEVASKVKAFPNPFTTKITLDIAAENSGQVQVTMWNAVGRQLMEQNVVVEEGFNTVNLDIRGDLPHGVYFLRVYLDGKMHQIKMLRE